MSARAATEKVADYAVVYLFNRPDFLYVREAVTVCKSEVVVFKGTARECRRFILGLAHESASG